MSYFKPFRSTLYRFGDEATFNKFQDLSAYVDIIDDIKDNVNFYQSYTLLDGDRPDNVSFRLYKTPNYHWTLFLLNDNIRERGWPISDQDVRAKAVELYPNTTLTTTEQIFSRFNVSSDVAGLTSGAVGSVIRRRLEFGQIIVSPTTIPYADGEVITTTEGGVFHAAVLTTATPEYNAVHHYEDGNGQRVDVDPFGVVPALFTPITYTEKLLRQNDQLREIKVIKPSAITEVVSAFTEALRT